MKRYEVEVFIDGQPTYIMDVPASTSEKAERYAVVWAMKMDTRMGMERITTAATGNFEDMT